MQNVKNKIGNHIGDMLIEEKMIVLAGILAVVGCLFAWSSWTVADTTYVDNGFGGKTWLIGWLITIFSAVSVLLALFPNTDGMLRKFGFGRMTFVFFLGVEGIFLAIIAMSVLGYSEYLTQELGFGIFMTFLGTAFVTLGGFVGMRRGSSLRPKANPQSDFLQFQEPKREHKMHDEISEEIMSPEEDLYGEEDEEDSEEENQQTLNL